MTMEEKYATNQRVHQGRNVARFRTFRGMKQTTLAEQLGLSQQTLSDYEQKEAIKPELLKQIAAILNVPTELLESLPDESPGMIFENNTFEEGSVANIAPYGQTESDGNIYNSSGEEGAIINSATHGQNESGGNMYNPENQEGSIVSLSPRGNSSYENFQNVIGPVQGIMEAVSKVIESSWTIINEMRAITDNLKEGMDINKQPKNKEDKK